MLPTRSVVLLTCLVVILSTGNVTGTNLIVGSGATWTIDDLYSVTTEYVNEGELVITETGQLHIEADVYNSIPAGTGWLDLGKVLSEGMIYAEQTIRFRDGSVLGGAVMSSDKIFFEGAVTVSGDISGKLHLEDAAILQLGEGILYGGFDLAGGSSLTSSTINGTLLLGIVNDSVIHAGATLSAKNVLLSWGNEHYSPSIVNAGTIESGALYLRSVELLNEGSGTITTSNLMLLEKSILDLRNNNTVNGGLALSNLLSIDSTSQIYGKTLEFVGVTVENWNSTNGGGIVATNLRFGEGTTLFGIGAVDAHTVFAEGSKLVLGLYDPGIDHNDADFTGFGNQGYVVTDFGNKNVTFESGSTIAMTIDPGGYGRLRTEGKVQIDDDVFLEIVNGSDFDDNDITQEFYVVIGNSDSVFSENLKFESLFFKLSNVFRFDYEDLAVLTVEISKNAGLPDYAVSPNQREFALMIERINASATANEAQKQMLDSLLRINSIAELRKVLGSLLGDIRANGLVAAMSQPWRVPLERGGMERLSLHTPKWERTANLSTTETEYFGQSVSPLSCNLWFDTYYNHTSLRSDGNASGGLGDRFGFYLGNEWTPTYETLFGWAFGYANGSFTQDTSHLRINDYQFGLYGGANLFNRNLQLRGYIGYGHLDFTHDRRVTLRDTLYAAHGSTPGDSVSASLMFVRPVDLSDRFLFKPTFAVDFERISQKGFREYGNSGIVLSYDGAEFQRLMLRLGASGEHSLPRGSIWGRLYYGVRVAGDTAAQSRTRFVGVTEPGVAVYSVNIGDSVFDVGLGGKHSLNTTKSFWIFGDYNGSFTKRSDSHTGSMGFIWKR